MAPHIIWPLRFVLPHHKGLRPAWLLRLGLFLYDHLGGRKLLPAARTLDLRRDAAGTPLKTDYRRAFEYSDCWVDDARLVVLNARDAADRGATILTRTKVEAVQADGGLWHIDLHDLLSGDRHRRTARALVNAAGPWVDQILQVPLGRNGRPQVRLVQGSHIVVGRLFDHDRCYIFQNADGRIVFAIPYEQDFTLIGTTDRDVGDDPGAPRISPEETRYLLAAVSDYFQRPVTEADIVKTYAAIRPLYDDGASSAQEATRDYVLTDDTISGAPLINVFGGKITTYRRLSEEVLQKVDSLNGRKTATWTADSTLPGGDFPCQGRDDLARGIAKAYPWLEATHLHRLVRTYGTKTHTLLAGCSGPGDLGQHFGADLHEVEVRYLMAQEWAVKADDIVWRRTKLDLRLSADEVERLDSFLADTRMDI